MLKAVTNLVNVSQITGVLPVVNGGTGVTTSTGTGNTVLSAAPTLSGNVTLSTGNLIVASGQGIDFSATSGAGTSELLNDYEEGTWTPGQGVGLVVVGTFSSSGFYTKVGRLVTVSGVIAGSTSVAFPNGTEVVLGLPFTPNAASMGIFADSGYTNISGARTISTALYSVGTGAAAANIVFSITYQV